jgi:hypothetical protein
MNQLIALTCLAVSVSVQARPVNQCYDKASGLFVIAVAKEAGVTETQALQVAGRAVDNADLRANYINGIKMIYENPLFKSTSADQIKELTLRSCKH